MLEILTNSSDLKRVSGFSRTFLNFEMSKVRASVCVIIYTIMYNITTVRIYTLFLNAVSACLAAGSDKPKTSMPGSCNAHARNLSTAK